MGNIVGTIYSVPVAAAAQSAVSAPPEIWQPTLIAAFVTGGVAILVLIVNAVVNTLMHREKLRADRDLAKEKFDADKALAERKLELDRSLDDWKRKAEFAEAELAGFYEARSRIGAIRSPASYSTENEDRQGRNEEDLELRQQRDVYYPVVRRLRENGEFFNGQYAKRYRAQAMFGEAGEAPYRAIWDVMIRIQVAAGSLMRRDTYQNTPQVRDHRQRMEERVWEGAATDGDDRLVVATNAAVAAAEAVFRPIIERRPENG